MISEKCVDPGKNVGRRPSLEMGIGNRKQCQRFLKSLGKLRQSELSYPRSRSDHGLKILTGTLIKSCSGTNAEKVRKSLLQRKGRHWCRCVWEFCMERW